MANTCLQVIAGLHTAFIAQTASSQAVLRGLLKALLTQWWVRCYQISPAWTDLSGFSRLHSLSLIDYPHAAHIRNSPMVCLPRSLRRLDINDLPSFQARPPCPLRQSPSR